MLSEREEIGSRPKGRMKILMLAVTQCLSFSGLGIAAQFGPSDHVYIDPRVVIQRPHYTEQQVTASMNIEALSAEAKAKILSQYREQDQPILNAHGQRLCFD